MPTSKLLKKNGGASMQQIYHSMNLVGIMYVMM